MKQLLLAALTMAAMSSAAFAQPLTLDESQLDKLTAGVNTTATNIATALNSTFNATATPFTVAVIANSNAAQSFQVLTAAP